MVTTWSKDEQASLDVARKEASKPALEKARTAGKLAAKNRLAKTKVKEVFKSTDI